MTSLYSAQHVDNHRDSSVMISCDGQLWGKVIAITAFAIAKKSPVCILLL